MRRSSDTPSGERLGLDLGDLGITLAWELADMEARRTSMSSKLEDADLTEDERAVLQEQLEEVVSRWRWWPRT